MTDQPHDGLLNEDQNDYCHILRCKIVHLTVLERRLMHVLNRLEAICDIIEPQSALWYDINMLLLNTHSVLTTVMSQQVNAIEAIIDIKHPRSDR